MSRVLRVKNNSRQPQDLETQEPQELRVSYGHAYASSVSDDPLSSDYVSPAETYDYNDYNDYSNQDQQKAPQWARAITLGSSIVLLGALILAIVFLLGLRNSRQDTQVAVSNGASAGSASASVSGLSTGPRTGYLAPDFSLVDVHTNQTVTLSALRGKPVFVNFWGTWCPPCRAEMPEMQRLYDKYPGQVVMLGVSMGPRDSPEQVKNFVDQYKYPWTFIHDTDSTVAIGYQVTAIPSSYFIDKNGVIKAIQVGGMNLDIMEKNFQLIR